MRQPRCLVSEAALRFGHQAGDQRRRQGVLSHVAVGRIVEHVVGMAGARCIVAINKDPEAPIFDIADYGIVGDLFEALPVLTEEIRKLKS